MVLSNKKLKQRLRAAVAESLSESVAETHPSNDESTNPDLNPKSQSLKQLLDSATQKPRLSKREKRRKKTLSSHDSEAVNRSSNGENCEENNEVETESMNDNNNNNSDKKKRKRDGDEDKVIEKVKKAKKNKKKKKKNAKNMEEKGIENGSGGSEEQGVAETVKNSESQENVDVATKVYVGGIPYYSTEDDIRSYFEGCGTITEVDCMKFPESGKFRGISIISFKTEAAAKRALALEGADMGGLFLKIQPYKTTRANKSFDFAPEIVEGYNRIYVGNLSWDITEDDLRKFFSDCTISSIRFGMDKETGEFRGYAHVDFSDSLSLTMALKLDQEIVCGRPVKISCAVPKKGAKPHPRSPPSKKADNAGVSSGSGKKRRTCYECGKPGHISTACPKKKTADQKNSSEFDHV